MMACGEREPKVIAPPTMHDSAVPSCFHGCLAFLHRHFPLQSPLLHPLTHLSTVNSSPRPGTASQSLNSSFQPLCFLGTCIPVPVQGTMCGCSKDCLIFISFKLPHVSCFCLKCFSSDSDNCPDVRIRPLLQFPHPLRAGPVPLILLFSP